MRRVRATIIDRLGEVCILIATLCAACATGGVRGAEALEAHLAARPLRALVGADVVPAPGAREPFAFLVGGHLYGRPGLPEPGDLGPARSLRANLDLLAGSEVRFLISLGDIVLVYREDFLAATLETLAALDMPVFNAPGNHELAEHRADYERRFGPTYGGFRLDDNLFLVLDTEREPWSLDEEQLDFLARSLELARAAGVRNVFVFGHRLLFATGDPRYELLFRKSNSRQGWSGTSNFVSHVRPLLADFARSGSVTWFAGDVGVPRSYGLFHDVDERHGIRYIATGLGDTPSDNLVLVRVDAARQVTLERLALVDPSMPALEDCDLAFWHARFADEP